MAGFVVQGCSRVFKDLRHMKVASRQKDCFDPSHKVICTQLFCQWTTTAILLVVQRNPFSAILRDSARFCLVDLVDWLLVCR